MIRNLLFFTVFVGLFAGCKQQDLTPSWVRIDQFQLTTNEETQGPNSHGITDAWVFMDNQSLGVFELPCKFPVLDDGEHNFVIFPGIKNNGISGTRTRYPLYTSHEAIETLTLNDTLVILPSITYKNSVQVAFLEDFEDAGISLVKGPSSDTDMVFVNSAEHPEIVKYGDKCGAIFLNEVDSLYTASTQSMMDLPKGRDVYLEIDYRNSNFLDMGVIARYFDGSVNEHNPLVRMNGQDAGTEVWKKIYIDLKDDVSVELAATSYEIFFVSLLEEASSTAEVYVDNIKVVYIE